MMLLQSEESLGTSRDRSVWAFNLSIWASLSATLCPYGKMWLISLPKHS